MQKLVPQRVLQMATWLATLGAIAPALAQRADTFNASTTYQTIDHFGAHDSWSGQAYGAWGNSQRNAMSDALFNKSNGIGLSGWYFHLAAGVDSTIASQSYPWNLRTQESFETGQGTYDWNRNAATRALLADAKSRGVEKYMMVAYSPTLRMTKNGKPYADAPGGNNLQTGFEQQYATYMADVLEHFKTNPNAAERVNFDYISPLNEPQYNWTGGQEGNGYLSQATIRAQVNALYDTLQTRGLTTGIRSPESGKIQDLYSGQNYLSQIASNATVNTKLGNTISYHSYFSDSNADMLARRQSAANAMASYPGWNLWQTEYSILGSNASSGLSGSGNDTTMTTALAVARTIHFDLTVANTAAWSYWLAATPWEHNYKDGLVYFDNTAQTFQVSKTGWALAHYARFIRPGSQRIAYGGANNSIGGLLVSAWRDNTDNDLTLVYVNQLTTAEVVNHTFSNTGSLKADYFTPYLTVEDTRTNVREQTQFLIGQDYTIPARSMMTFVSGTFNEDNSAKSFPAIIGNRNYVLGSGLLTLTNAAGTYGGVMSGAGGVIKRGIGEMVLTGNSTFTGGTVVEQGTLALSGASNLPVGRLGAGSLLTVKSGGVVRVDFWNALGGYVAGNIPSVRLEMGGTLTTGDGFQSNLGNIVFAGGTLASGAPSQPYGSWTLNNDVLATGGTVSTINALGVQLNSSRSFSVDADSTLRVTGSLDDYQGASSSTLIKLGTGTLEVARSSVENIEIQVGTVRLIASGADTVSLSAKTLNIATGATFDIADDISLIDYGAASPISALSAAVREGQLLTSASGKRIAVVDNAVLGLAELGGETVDLSTVVIRSATGGDANLDDVVNFDDLLTLAQNYSLASDGWLDGDFDYSGAVDFDDLLILAQSYNGGPAVVTGGTLFIADWQLARSLVPEPGSLLGLFMFGVTRRRRFAEDRQCVDGSLPERTRNGGIQKMKTDIVEGVA